jgi:tRNA threonylcarbamoyl adenosine modification protein (Sua5/YciO/YrdC/YwlC family)
MEIISLTPGNFQNAVMAASRAIQRGEVVLAPTDTVYGLLASALSEPAVKKVYAIKERAQDKPLPIFVKNMAMAKKIALLSAKQLEFLETKWPGKFTAVLRQNPASTIFGTNGKTIALRIPFYPFVNSLLETANQPLTATSANLSGQPAATKIDNVLNQLARAGAKPDLIINAGDLDDSNPSTIVDLTQSEPKIMRP